MIGYLTALALCALCTACALWPPRRGPLATPAYLVAMTWNEVPALGVLLTLVATLQSLDDLGSALAPVAVGLLVLVWSGLALVAWRAVGSRHAPERALRDALGPNWRDGIDPRWARGLRIRPSVGAGLLAPVPRGRRDVERIADIAYGDAGRRNRLDVYRHRSRPAGCPVLVHLHGGHFVSGTKNRESLPLLHRMAGRGWLCISATYRRGRRVGFPDPVVDVKRVLAWVREHGPAHGADPETVIVAGNSAGAYLAAFAALTPGWPEYQPGFETADTSVTAAVCLYGYYGRTVADDPRSSPAAHGHAGAPPFYVLHGDRDTVTSPAAAREFSTLLREVSDQPVVHAELPGAQHSFDYFASVRARAAVDGIEAFATWVLRTRPPAANPDRGR